MLSIAWVVEFPLIAPYWLGSMFGPADLKCWTGYFSISFSSISVRDIGRRSLGTGLTLGIGTTSGLFQMVGIKLYLRELLNIAQTGLAMVFESSFKIQFGMASGPMALDILLLESCFSSGVMMNLSWSGS